jgi:hypothetical protein
VGAEIAESTGTPSARHGFALPVLLLLALTVPMCREREPFATHQAMVGVGMGTIMMAVVGVMLLGGRAGHVHGNWTGSQVAASLAWC